MPGPQVDVYCQITYLKTCGEWLIFSVLSLIFALLIVRWATGLANTLPCAIAMVVKLLVIISWVYNYGCAIREVGILANGFICLGYGVFVLENVRKTCSESAKKRT